MRDRLHVFNVVAEKLNFTQAAQDLFMSQPAVSAAIRVLETEYGLPLFSRAGGHVELTEAGRILHGYSQKMQDLEGQARKEIKALVETVQGKLVIGASTTIAQYILPKLIGEFAKAYPQVSFVLVSQITDQISQQLLDGKVDVAIVEGEVDNSQFKTSAWITDELRLYTATNTPSADSITFEELQKLPLLIREKGSGHRQLFEQSFRSRGVELSNLNVVLELGSTEAIKLAIENGLGWSFLSSWSCKKERALGTLKVIPVRKFKMVRDFSILQTKDSENTSLVQRFIGYLEKAAMDLSVAEL